MQKQFKVAIVGPEESKWTNLQKLEAKDKIANILLRYPKGRILVSGHCPKGGVDIWAEETAKHLLLDCYDKKYIFPAEASQWNDGERVNCPKCGFMWDCNKPMKDALYYLNKHSLECDGELIHTKMKGYRSRNIQIAEACDVLYCIVPYDESGKCIHHDNPQYNHKQNGGCWTMQWANKLGKETYLVVIK